MSQPSSDYALTWWAAFRTALLVEGVIVALMAFFFFVGAPLFAGADNPLFYWLVWLVQLPASLLYAPLLNMTYHTGPSDVARLVGSAVLISLVHVLCLALAIHMKRVAFSRRWDKR